MSEVQVPVAGCTAGQKPTVSFIWGIPTVLLPRSWLYLCLSDPLLPWPWLTAC